MERIKFQENKFLNGLWDGILEEFLEACFWSGLGVAEGVVCGIENDGNHFLVRSVGVVGLGK